jgi:hypothetical protein
MSDERKAGLRKGSVSERAAFARELALHGSWDDVEELVDVAWNERKSTGVRLYAAAAAADIACRARGAFGQSVLDDIQKAQAFQWAFGKDPGDNPSMLMLAAAADPERVLPRLGRILRDPRADVRLGAITALRRQVLSAMGEPESVVEVVGNCIADARVPPDTTMHLLQLVGEAGLHELRRELVEVDTRTEQLAAVRLTALDRLDARQDPTTWQGIWRSEGLDVYELAAEPRTDDVGVMGPTTWSGPGGTRPFALEAGGARIGDDRARLVWANPMGTHEPAIALHIGTRTWWKLDGANLVSLLDTKADALVGLPEDAAALLRAAADGVEGAAKVRAVAIVALLTGDAEGAVATLDGPLSKKRPRTDLYYWRGRARAELGRGSEAAADLDAFLERAKADAPHRAHAESLRAGL